MAGPDRKKVLLGLSGGVDSTTAALLLSQQGFEVTGYFFDVTGKHTDDLNDARDTAEKLGIPLITEDVSKDFEALVIRPFIEDYLNGRTPNPCIICNPLVKFAKMIEKADEIGAYYIATGHYAKVVEDNGHHYIAVSDNQAKDQSYMLYRLPEMVLERLILPLGGFSDKSDIRSFAKEKGFRNAEKRDSQEICFIDPDDNYKDYIERLGFSTPPGNFTSADGKILGEHKGFLHYTIGQRKGLGIALGRPAFVVRLEKETNSVVLGENEDLFTTAVRSRDNVTIGCSLNDLENMELTAKVRYSSRFAEVRVRCNEDGTLVSEFAEHQRAVTPGQSIVYYKDNKVIGGGIICE